MKRLKVRTITLFRNNADLQVTCLSLSNVTEVAVQHHCLSSQRRSEILDGTPVVRFVNVRGLVQSEASSNTET